MKKKKISPKRGERNNDYEAERKLIHILNANFKVEKNSCSNRADNLLSTPEEALEDVKNFQRRVIRLRRKFGLSK